MDLPVRTNRGVQGLEGRVRLGVTRPVLHLPSIVHSVLDITELLEVLSEEGSVGMETVLEIQEDSMVGSMETMVDSTVTMEDSMETMGDSMVTLVDSMETMVILEVEVLPTVDMDKTVM